MPSVETDNLYQAALVWPYAGVDPNGQPTHGTPYQVQTRFSWTRRETKRPDGTSITLDAQAVVTKVIPIDSLFWVDPRTALERQYVSSIDYWDNTASLQPDNQRLVVISYDGSPDLKNRYFHRQVGLMRHHSGGNTSV